MKNAGMQLKLISPAAKRPEKTEKRTSGSPTTIDLFCGAGGITEGFRQAGYQCLYANDRMPEAIETFKYNHPAAWSECRNIEEVDPAEVRERLQLLAAI